MIATRMTIAAVVLALATAAAAQTHAELLEKAIFTDETAGDLPGAIRIYERLVSTPGVSRDIAARAQTRLAESRRRRDQAAVALPGVHAPAATPQTAVLAPAKPASVAERFTQQDPQEFRGMWSGNYDSGRPVTVRGRIAQVVWTNPQALLVIDGFDGNRWGFTLPPPNALLLRGFNKNTFRLGDEAVVGGFIATGEAENCPTRLPNACATLENGALHASASIITAGDGTVLFDWAVLRSMPAQTR
jgi:hypothetical protein